jgi:hypothetical protein
MTLVPSHETTLREGIADIISRHIFALIKDPLCHSFYVCGSGSEYMFSLLRHLLVLSSLTISSKDSFKFIIAKQSSIIEIEFPAQKIYMMTERSV